MSSFKKIVLTTGAGLLAAASLTTANAQSTDGFHGIQIFPVVVDSASFTQRFNFSNPDAANNVVVTPEYFPGEGTTQAAPILCPDFTIPAGGQKVFTTIREICPALAAGNQFGYLYTIQKGTGNQLYSGYSRVSNGAGIGFSLESFPAHTFTSADTTVIGLRRLAATSSTPAYQTNCFVGNVQERTPNLNLPNDVTFELFSSTGVALGNGMLSILPGKLVRMLDIFQAAGAPAGDQTDAYIRFRENGTGEPGLMTFCTVQDNTSFGGDFRIGKQERGYGTQYSGVGAQDDSVVRDATVGFDIRTSGETAGRAFSIPASASSNTHVVYFRHPDYVQCEIIDPATGVRALETYGLELRLVDQYVNVLAGGNNATGFGKVYLGDKTDRNNGTNGRFTIEVESSEVNVTAVRPYRLHCQSGSGHTLGDIIRSAGENRF